jgi:hypothetical protein
MLIVGSAYGADQTATLTAPANVEPGTGFDVGLMYNTSDNNNELGGFGVYIFFDPSFITYASDAASVKWNADIEKFVSTPLVPIANPAPDGMCDAFGVEHGSYVVGITFKQTSGDNPIKFPNIALPVNLVTLAFAADAGATGSTSITVYKGQVAPTYTFQKTDATVSFGGGNTYDVTFNIFGNGYLNTDGNTTPVVHTVNEGADCPTVKAIPMTDNEFVNWTLNEAEYATTAAITVPNVLAAATYTANFKASSSTTHTVSFAVSGNGTVAPSAPQTVDDGVDCATVTASANAGNEFVNWTGPNSFVSTDAALTVTNVTADATYTANFKVSGCDANSGTLSSSPGNGGPAPLLVTFTVIGSVGELEFNYGSGEGTGTAKTHTYNTVGTFYATVTAKDTVNNCTATPSGQVKIEVTPGGGCTGYKPGDYDRDDVIDIFDALGVAMWVVGMNPPKEVIDADPCLKAALDVDGADGLGINDALQIARHDVKLPCDCILDEYLK